MTHDTVRQRQRRIGNNKTLRWGGCGDKTAEQLYMPGGAMQADGLQVLFHTLVVLDLSGDRNGHRGAADTAGDFNRFAAGMKKGAKELNPEECFIYFFI